jgi:hypothetical protein
MKTYKGRICTIASLCVSKKNIRNDTTQRLSYNLMCVSQTIYHKYLFPWITQPFSNNSLHREVTYISQTEILEANISSHFMKYILIMYATVANRTLINSIIQRHVHKLYKPSHAQEFLTEHYLCWKINKIQNKIVLFWNTIRNNFQTEDQVKLNYKP